MTEFGFEIFSLKRSSTHIFKADNSFALSENNNVIELFFGSQVTHSLYGQLGILTRNFPGREFYVLSIESLMYICHGNTIRSQPYRVNPQTHGIAFLSPNLHTTHPGNSLNTLSNYVFCKIAYLQMISVIALQGHGDDRVRICIGF